MPKKKRILRGGRNTEAPVPNVPNCPRHGEPMSLQPEHLRWHCTVDGCRAVAYPRIDEDSGRPIVGKGELEVLTIMDGAGKQHVYLRSRGNNVMIDITEYSRSFQVQQAVGKKPVYTLGIVLDAHTNIDQRS